MKDGDGAVLVTGDAGFIGSHVVDALLARGHAVVCLDNFDDYYDPAVKRRNLSEARRSDRFTLIEGDIRDPEALARVFASRPISRVFHAAARAGVRPSLHMPLLYEEVNVRGTLQLLEVCKDKRSEERRVGKECRYRRAADHTKKKKIQHKNDESQTRQRRWQRQQ